MRYLISVLLLLTGCTTAYEPQVRNSSGYSDTQVNTDSFIVGFKGGEPLRTKELALMRSAEIALAYGYTHFVVTQIDDLSTVSVYSVNSTLPYSYSATEYYLYHQDGRTHTVTKPHFVYTIVCYESRPEMPSYDARMVLDNLSEKHGLVK